MRLSKIHSTIKDNRQSVDIRSGQNEMQLGHMITTERDLTKEFTTPVSHFSRDFETMLVNSHVYGRTSAGHELDMSAAGSLFSRSDWSRLSRFSLNDISKISVYRLPITLDEIEEFGSHLTFGRFLKSYQIRASVAGLSFEGELTAQDTVASAAERLKQNPAGFEVTHRRKISTSHRPASSTEGAFQYVGRPLGQQIYRMRRARKRGRSPQFTVTVPTGLTNRMEPAIEYENSMLPHKS